MGKHYCRSSFLVALFVVISATTTSAAENSDLVRVEVDDEMFQYSMSANPPVDSPVVKAEIEILLGSLDLESFVRNLGLVGKYVRVAYNGIGAAGPKFQDLQNEVQSIGFDISRVCDKSAVTIASYKTTTRTVLFELKSSYEFLIASREVMALDSFSIIAELAEKMAKAAETLQIEFERLEVKVRDALQRTQSRRAEQKLRVSDLRVQQEKTRENVKTQEKLAKEHEKLEAEFRAERHRYERKEDKAISAKSGFLSRLGNAITSHFGLGSLFDEDNTARASKWRQKSIEKLENEKEQRKLKHAALQLMAEMIHEIKVMGEEEELSEVAVNALHKASGSLQQLIALLKQAALFWTHLKQHCLGIADDKLQQKIQKFVAEFSKEERKDYWTSNSFKQRMFLYISKWVALYSVSNDYLEQIKLTQNDLYKFITENPTYEESRRNLRQLAEDFEQDLKSAEDRMIEQDNKADKEIQQMKAKQKTEL